MYKRDNEKDYVVIVNETIRGQRQLFEKFIIDSQNLVVQFEKEGDSPGVSRILFQNFFGILRLHRNRNHRSLHDGDHFLFPIFKGMNL